MLFLACFVFTWRMRFASFSHFHIVFFQQQPTPPRKIGSVVPWRIWRVALIVHHVFGVLWNASGTCWGVLRLGARPTAADAIRPFVLVVAATNQSLTRRARTALLRWAGLLFRVLFYF